MIVALCWAAFRCPDVLPCCCWASAVLFCCSAFHSCHNAVPLFCRSAFLFFVLQLLRCIVFLQCCSSADVPLCCIGACSEAPPFSGLSVLPCCFLGVLPSCCAAALLLCSSCTASLSCLLADMLASCSHAAGVSLSLSVVSCSFAAPLCPPALLFCLWFLLFDRLLVFWFDVLPFCRSAVLQLRLLLSSVVVLPAVLLLCCSAALPWCRFVVRFVVCCSF